MVVLAVYFIYVRTCVPHKSICRNGRFTVLPHVCAGGGSSSAAAAAAASSSEQLLSNYITSHHCVGWWLLTSKPSLYDRPLLWAYTDKYFGNNVVHYLAIFLQVVHPLQQPQLVALRPPLLPLVGRLPLQPPLALLQLQLHPLVPHLQLLLLRALPPRLLHHLVGPLTPLFNISIAGGPSSCGSQCPRQNPWQQTKLAPKHTLVAIVTYM